MKSLLNVAAASALLMLSGCSQLSGINRMADLDQALDPSCAQKAISGVEGVTVGELTDGESTSFGILPHWGPETTTTKTIDYTVPGADSVIFHVMCSDRTKTSRIQHGWLRRVGEDIDPTQAADAFVAMVKVEREIAARCGVRFKMKTSCSFDCSSLIAGELDT